MSTFVIGASPTQEWVHCAWFHTGFFTGRGKCWSVQQAHAHVTALTTVLKFWTHSNIALQLLRWVWHHNFLIWESLYETLNCVCIHMLVWTDHLYRKFQIPAFMMIECPMNPTCTSGKPWEQEWKVSRRVKASWMHWQMYGNYLTKPCYESDNCVTRQAAECQIGLFQVSAWHDHYIAGTP